MKRPAWFCAVLAAALPLLVGSCAAVDPDEVTQTLAPDFDAYKDFVDPYLNRQCGTLDCHGQQGRPFRSYGARGLRIFDPQKQLIAGDPADPREQVLNFQSILGLEPEATRRVVAGEQVPGTLLLIRKPSNVERHKGGTMMQDRSVGFLCVTGWLQTPNGQPLSESVQRACERAMALP